MNRLDCRIAAACDTLMLNPSRQSLIVGVNNLSHVTLPPNLL